MLNKPFCLQNT